MVVTLPGMPLGTKLTRLIIIISRLTSSPLQRARRSMSYQAESYEEEIQWILTHFGTSYLTSGSADNGRVAAIEKAYDDLVTPSRGDTRDALSTETAIEYLESLDVNLENAEMFVVMELVQAPAVGEISRQGFVEGWKATDLTTFSNTAQKKLVRDRINTLASDPAYFKKVYRHAFIAGKEATQKALPVENATEYWKTLFAAPGKPWVSASRDWGTLWQSFLAEKWSRSVNKDMWNMTLEFAYRTLDDENLTFYSDQDSWPGVIDDFVAWYRKLYPEEAKDKMDVD